MKTRRTNCESVYRSRNYVLAEDDSLWQQGYRCGLTAE